MMTGTQRIKALLDGSPIDRTPIGGWYHMPLVDRNVTDFTRELIASTDLNDGVVWHLDVGSSHPGAVVGPKGWAVRPLKRYASWVQNVVRQFGPYPAWA